jgi:hypothetical protein
MARKRRRAWTASDKKRLLAKSRREAETVEAETGFEAETVEAETVEAETAAVLARFDEAVEPTPEEREQQRREQERILATGHDCLRRIQNCQTFEDWRGVGAALMVITQQTLAELELDEWDPNNKALVREFGLNWSLYEGRAGSNHKPLSKQERSALRQLMTNPQIHAWRASLDPEAQRALTHPNTVVTRWKREGRRADLSAEELFAALDKYIADRNSDDGLDKFVEHAADTWVGGLRLTTKLAKYAAWFKRADEAAKAKLADPEEGEALKERTRFNDRVRLGR